MHALRRHRQCPPHSRARSSTRTHRLPRSPLRRSPRVHANNALRDASPTARPPASSPSPRPPRPEAARPPRRHQRSASTEPPRRRLHVHGPTAPPPPTPPSSPPSTFSTASAPPRDRLSTSMTLPQRHRLHHERSDELIVHASSHVAGRASASSPLPARQRHLHCAQRSGDLPIASPLTRPSSP